MRRTIRASSLPRVMACPASFQIPEIVITPASPVRDMGTAVHAVMADIVRAGLDSLPDLAPYIKEYDVDGKELGFLAWRGMEIWRRFRDRLDPETVRCENEYTYDIRFRDKITLTGHVDVCAQIAGADTIVIIDWKSGYSERNYTEQLTGYALLVLSQYPPAITCSESFEVKVITAWLRSGKWDVLDLTKDDIGSFESRLANVLLNTERAYAPDDAHCVYCPRAMECPAKTQLVRSAADSFYPLQEKSAAALTPREQLAAVYDQSLLLKRALDNYRDALKTTIAVDGPLPLTDGRVLSLTQEERETILFGPETIGIVAPYLSVDSVDIDGVLDEIGRDAVTVNKTKLGEAVAKHAPRNQKGAAKAAVMTELAAAGCIRKTAYETVKAVVGITQEK